MPSSGPRAQPNRPCPRGRCHCLVVPQHSAEPERDRLAASGRLRAVRGAAGHRPSLHADTSDRDPQRTRRGRPDHCRGRRDRLGHADPRLVPPLLRRRVRDDDRRPGVRSRLVVAHPAGLAWRRRQPAVWRPGVLAVQRPVVLLGRRPLSRNRAPRSILDARNADQSARGGSGNGDDGIDRGGRVVAQYS